MIPKGMYFEQTLCHRVWVIPFIHYTLAFITLLSFDRMFAESMNFYENNMILIRFILSDPAKSGLESGAWIDGHDIQKRQDKKKTEKTLALRKNMSVILFSAVYQNKAHEIPHPVSSSI